MTLSCQRAWRASDWLVAIHGSSRRTRRPVATSSVRLGIGAAELHDPAPAFDKDRVGYWRIKVPDVADWRLPNPLDPAGRALPGRTHWYGTTTLAAAAELGYEITPVEAYLWPASGRLLDGWYRRLRDARAGLDQVDVDARAARDLVKATYTRTIGGFAARHLAERPWHRPDWRHAIIATARSNVLRRVHTIGEQAGAWPVAILIDAVLYVSDVACPVCAWPGDPKLLGRGLGLYSPYGSAELAGHAQFLTGHGYKGTAALTQPGAWLTEHGCEQHRPPGDQ